MMQDWNVMRVKIKLQTKQSCDNEKVSNINGAQESACTVPQAHPAVSCFAVVVQLFRL